MRKALIISLILLLFGSLSIGLRAQTKKTKKAVKPMPTPAATPLPTPEPPAEVQVKRNERPVDEKSNKRNAAAAPAYSPVYFYEFTRSGFLYGHVLIEHDETGKGKISFRKEGYDETITDPIQLTPVTMKNLADAFTELNFLTSNENYQTERDHANMGNVSITIKKEGRERIAKYNWTENKQAKFLMDEYRRIANEYTWKFEIGVVRENQPLQAPGLMTTLDNYIRQNEISDPPHLAPLLTELSNDERLPLIARSHAERLVKQIEKTKK